MSHHYSIDHFRKLLPVNKLDLDTELEQQSQVQEMIARQVAGLNTQCNQAKDSLALVEARLTNDMASYASQKMTVQQVAAQVQRHPDRIRAWDVWQVARQELEEWQHLLDAWRGRSFTMTNLANLYAHDYFALNSLSGKDRNDDYTSLRSQAAASRRRRKLQDGSS